MGRRTRVLLAAAALFAVAANLPTMPSSGAPTTVPSSGEATSPVVGGDDLITWAAAQAVDRFADAPGPYALLARADRHPDALAASPLTLDGPLLLTSGDRLEATVASSLDEAVATGGTVYLLGGEAALSTDIATEVAALGFQPIRLAGPDRYTTAALVAEVAAARTAGLMTELSHEVVVLVRGDGDGSDAWADAIAVGAWAARTATPVLLTQRDQLPEPTALALDRLDPDTVLVIGGVGAISPAVVQQLYVAGHSPQRLAGPDRAATAQAIAETLWAPLIREARGHATGQDFPGYVLFPGWDDDGWAWGLVAAGLSAGTDQPLLPWQRAGEQARLPAPTAAQLNSCYTDETPGITILGALVDEESQLTEHISRAAQQHPNVVLLGARGSGANPPDWRSYGPDGAGGRTLGVARHLQERSDLDADALRLVGVKYPAVTYEGFPFRYRSSVEVGADDTLERIEQIRASCAPDAIVLVGWSQGAHVVADAWTDRLDPATRAAADLGGIVVFADPRAAGGDPNVRARPVPLPAGADGIATAVGFTPRAWPDDSLDRTASWCHPDDLVCAHGGRSFHGARYYCWEAWAAVDLLDDLVRDGHLAGTVDTTAPGCALHGPIDDDDGVRSNPRA